MLFDKISTDFLQTFSKSCSEIPRPRLYRGILLIVGGADDKVTVIGILTMKGRPYLVGSVPRNERVTLG